MSTKDELYRQLDTHLCDAYKIADELLDHINNGSCRTAMKNVRRRIELAMHHAIQIKGEDQ